MGTLIWSSRSYVPSVLPGVRPPPSAICARHRDDGDGDYGYCRRRVGVTLG